jgi:hypothetical protein
MVVVVHPPSMFGAVAFSGRRQGRLRDMFSLLDEAFGMWYEYLELEGQLGVIERVDNP